MPHKPLEINLPLEPIEIRGFQPQNIKSSTDYTNLLARYEMAGKLWFVKKIIPKQITNTKEDYIFSKNTAYREIVAQEFLRLIIPTQPETCLAYDPIDNYYCIMSREISGFRSLFREKKYRVLNSEFEDVIAAIAAGEYTHLGEVVLTAVYLQEIDLKNGNVGLDEDKNVVKIDGDLSLVSVANKPVLHQFHSPITPTLLENLPNPIGHGTYQWLNIKIQGYLQHERVNFVSRFLSNNVLFRAEVNKAILKIALCSSAMLQDFLRCLVDNEEDFNNFLRLLLDRRNQLIDSALQLESFRRFILSPKAVDYKDHHFAYLTQFKLQNEYYVYRDQQRQIDVEMEDRFIVLQEKARTLQEQYEHEQKQGFGIQDALESSQQLQTAFASINFEAGEILGTQGKSRTDVADAREEEKEVESSSRFRMWRSSTAARNTEKRESIFSRIFGRR